MRTTEPHGTYVYNAATCLASAARPIINCELPNRQPPTANHPTVRPPGLNFYGWDFSLPSSPPPGRKRRGPPPSAVAAVTASDFLGLLQVRLVEATKLIMRLSRARRMTSRPFRSATALGIRGNPLFRSSSCTMS